MNIFSVLGGCDVGAAIDIAETRGYGLRLGAHTNGWIERAPLCLSSHCPFILNSWFLICKVWLLTNTQHMRGGWSKVQFRSTCCYLICKPQVQLYKQIARRLLCVSYSFSFIAGPFLTSQGF
jgi:hypothetical protein